MTAPTRPVLRYHGAKWRCAHEILALMPAHRVYVEPFGGSAAILLRKPRSYAEVYNDLADEVVNVFRVLRDPETAELLRQSVALTPFSRTDFRAAYQKTKDPVERARRAIVRAFMGFGSASFNAKHGTGFRANSSRSGTTPARDWKNYPPQIPLYVERLRGVVIENMPALELMPKHDGPETLFYVDPPYPKEVRAVGATTGVRQRYIHEFTPEDHRALATALKQLDGMVIVSGRPCELYDRDLYAGWERRTFAHLDDGARTRTEAVWMNAACVERLSLSLSL